MNKFLALERKYQIILISIMIVVILSLGYLVGKGIKGYDNVDEGLVIEDIKDEGDKEVVEEENVKIVVNIKGAVKNPGIYEFSEGARVNDAIKEAILRDDAAIDALNLASFLEDEDEIVVPTKEEVIKEEKKVVEKDDGLVNINKCSQGELEDIPGVGPVLAGNIIKYRDSVKGFKKIEDLLNVSGIGEKTLEKLKAYIKL